MGEEPTTVQNTLEDVGDFTVDEKSDNEIIVEEVKEEKQLHKDTIDFSETGGAKVEVITEHDPSDEEIFEWKEVQFFVKDINNKNHTFLLPLSTTVEELKKQLKTKTGFEVRQQRLSCNGKNMEDDKMLEFYGVQQNTTIIQLARLLGGN